MNQSEPTLGRLPGRRVVHVLRLTRGRHVPACVNSYTVRGTADIDKTAEAPTCRRCQKK